MMIVVSDELEIRARQVSQRVLRAPFEKRTWSELLFVLMGTALAGAGIVFVGVTMAAGAFFAVTFIGLVIVALSVRGARVIGGFHRDMARNLLGEHIEAPEAFISRPGFFGWLQSALRDRVGWRAILYIIAKAALAIIGILTAISVWFDAFSCFSYPVSQGHHPSVYGLAQFLFPPGYFSVSDPSWFHGLAVFWTGILLFFAAPWVTRLYVYLDRWMMRSLLGPGAMAVRVRSLEHARTQTVDASAATLRRIERDLHDGTQAQLVAVAMRLGQAKEKLADIDTLDLEQVRRLVDDAHSGAKEAIVELRDLARGIHPPALDIGLEGALSTLSARSATPTELSLQLHDRPTPAIEAIAYFCVAELLANVAQHANASRATVSCVQHGRWMRIVVRDDGTGGAHLARTGSSSSGLAGLADRVRAIDGRFEVVSPPRGPTVVTIDLPLHA